MARVKQFNLPDPGEGLVEAEIVTWKVKVGDTVKVNDIVVEIETAKSLVELPVPYAGTVTDLLVPEGETVAVGTPIIAVDTGVDDGLPEAPAPADAGGDEDEEIEAGKIGGAAPGGRVAVLVGYGPRMTEAKRRPRKGAVPAVPAPVAPARRTGRPGARRGHPRTRSGTRRRAGRRTGRWRSRAGQAAGAQVRQGPRRRPHRRGRLG